MKIILAVFLSLIAFTANARTLKLEPGACDMLVKHVPSPDVEYQSGLDAYGRPVASADLAAPQVRLGAIEIPLTVDLANRLHLPQHATPAQNGNTGMTGIGVDGSPGTYGNEGYIGTVTVDGNAVLLDGQPLTDETEANLAVLCMKANP